MAVHPVSSEDGGQFSNVAIQILQRESERSRVEINEVEKQLAELIAEDEASGSSAALMYNEQTILKKEIDKMKGVTETLREELNGWDSSLQKPLQHYKEMKTAIESYTAVRGNIQKLISQVDSTANKTEILMEAVKSSMETALSKTQEDLRQIVEDSKSTASGVQTQLKIVETRKKTLESQLSQKTDENKELTKICEELLNQRSQ